MVSPDARRDTMQCGVAWYDVMAYADSTNTSNVKVFQPSLGTNGAALRCALPREPGHVCEARDAVRCGHYLERAYGTSRYGTVQYRTVWYRTIWYDNAIRCCMIWQGMMLTIGRDTNVPHATVLLCCTIRYGMAWHGMVWCGMVRHGMVWYGMV